MPLFKLGAAPCGAHSIDRLILSPAPTELVGFVVSVKWTDSWYDGIVLRYNDTTKRHFVKYMDSDDAGW